MALFVAVPIIVLSVINPAAIGGGPTDGEEVTYSYGPFGIDYGPLGQIRSNRWAHGMGYALFTATLAYAFVAPVRTDRRQRLALCVCLAVALGICMELVQMPIPYRQASVLEVIVNTTGACLVASVWWLLRRTVRFGNRDETLS